MNLENKNLKTEPIPVRRESSPSKLRVAVVPYYKQWLKNQMFSADCNINSGLMEPNIAWFKKCEAGGIEIATSDLLPVEQADVVIFFDLPAEKSEVLDIKRRAPNAKYLLVLYESPFERPHWFNPKNHDEFDAVLTFNPHLWQKGGKYLRLFLPTGMPPVGLAKIPFDQRRLGVMVNTNFYFGLRAQSRPWQVTNRYRTLWQAGWRFNLRDCLQARHSLFYQGRREIARVAERFSSEVLDVYGSNWSGRNSGWYYRFFPDAPYKTARGKFDADKLTLLGRYRFVIAYENYVSDVGYVSEKIFDAFHAGSVPIYLGDADISKWIDPECFVDARKFKSPQAVLEFVQSCDRSAWEKMYAAGQRYLQAEQICWFQPEHFAETMVNAILHAAQRTSGPFKTR